MANEIGESVKKCKILLLDIEGTTTSISFVKDELFPYAEQNVKQFLNNQWENADVQEAVVALRKLSKEDKDGGVEGVVDIPGEDAPKEEQIEGLVKNVKWLMSCDRKAGPLKHLQGLIWRQGYDNGDIKGHVYDDVPAALEAWRSADDHKVYIYSSGSVQAQKLLFGQSTAGDLLKLIDGHFDTAVGGKQDATSYTAIAKQIDCKPEDILFLTDIYNEATAARSAGCAAALVRRAGNAPLPAGADSFPALASLADLAGSNKRKPDPQDLDTPAAKILKTGAEQSVKPIVETATAEPESAASEKASTEAAEPMEVEGTATSSEETETASKVKEKITIEELDSNEAASIASVVDIEPTAVKLPTEEKKEEKEDKTEQKDTVEETEAPINEKGDAPVLQKIAHVDDLVVEEVTDEKSPPVAAEIIDDVMPIVEEPDNSEEMEELKNVGDVLEKECDEIMSKVNNVTNLENIAAKPILNSIAEETMETDSGDTNDIVEGILDNELENEMKQCADIEPDIITKMTDEVKTELVNKNDAKKDGVLNENNKNISEMKDTATQEMDSDNSENVLEKKDSVEEKITNASEKEEILTENNVENVVESSLKENEPEGMSLVVTQNKESQIEVNSAEVTKEPESKVIPTTGESVIDEVKSVEVETAKKSQETKPEKEPDNLTETATHSKVTSEEPQLNGKATNGDTIGANGDAKDATDVVINGDAIKEGEISARLTDGSVENGKVNGSNGDAIDAEKGQGDCKVESESSDIKVKLVTMDEPRTDPKEQPTEA